MPILAAIAAIIVVAAAISVGQQLGHDVAPLLAVAGPIALALVLFVALWLWHRRRMHELKRGRFDFEHDQLGMRRITVKAHDRWFVCSDCGLPIPDMKASWAHVEWHTELAELLESLEAKRAEREPEAPWSAVAEVDPDELVPPDLPPSPPRVDAEQLERAERDQFAQFEQLEPETAAVGEWEAKARAFRASMTQLVKTGRRDHATVSASADDQEGSTEDD
jgi:hypothetical protein